MKNTNSTSDYFAKGFLLMFIAVFLGNVVGYTDFSINQPATQTEVNTQNDGIVGHFISAGEDSKPFSFLGEVEEVEEKEENITSTTFNENYGYSDQVKQYFSHCTASSILSSPTKFYILYHSLKLDC